MLVKLTVRTRHPTTILKSLYLLTLYSLFFNNLTWLWNLTVVWQIYCIWCEAVFFLSQLFVSIRIKNCLFLLKPAKSLGVAPVTVWCFFQYKAFILTKTAQPTRAFCLELRSCERGDFVLFLRCSRSINSEKGACDKESNVTKLKRKTQERRRKSYLMLMILNNLTFVFWRNCVPLVLRLQQNLKKTHPFLIGQ